MATTLLKLKELSQQTIEAIVKSPDAWKKYLNAAPNIFRYSFEDQLLIYAQAPKATAVATYDVWNKIMHRAVKKGSCGIGLIHTKRRYEKIDYVFDVTQTAEKYDSRSLNIWKVTEKNETLVRTYLQNTIDIEEGMESIPELLHELTRESVDDVIDDLQDALKEDVEGTYLEDLEEDQLKHDFQELLENSIFYVCLSKCGYDPEMYLSSDSFQFITNFNDISVLRHLGYATTETCNSILHGITVFLIRNQKNIDQKITQPETTPEVLTKISAEKRVPNFGTQKEEHAEEEEPDNHVLRTVPKAPVRVDEVIEADDDYTQLEFIPSEAEQSEQIQLEIASRKTENDAGYILDSEIDAILRLGGGEENSQHSIAARLINGLDKEEFAEFLSREYGTGGKGVYLNNRKISVWYDQSGLRFARGESAQDRYDQLIRWQEAADRIKKLYEDGKYLPNSIVVNALQVTEKKYAQRVELLFRDAGVLPEGLKYKEEWGDVIQQELSEKNGQEKIKTVFDTIDKMIQTDSSMPSWIKINNAKYQKIFEELISEEKHYILQSSDIFMPEKQFITEDEINAILGNGSGVEGGKKRIYNFLTKEHSIKEKIEFLKNEYGIGGRTPGVIGSWFSSENHDAKGIVIEKEFCGKVILKWNMVLRRIETMIQKNQYLTEKSESETVVTEQEQSSLKPDTADQQDLGSGPAAFSTHEYISKLLGEMTIDTRNDGVTTGVHGNSSLNNQRAGRGLMTPGEVKRMDRKKCLIFMEGQYPIMDWKNLPFDTAVWKESKRLAGNTGYKHPVRVVYNPKTMTYRTIRNKQDFQVLDKKDVEFYKEAEKTDRSIKVCEINEEDFLYLNFDTNPTPTEEELIQMFEQSKKDTGLQEKAIEMEEQSTQDNISVVPNFGTEAVVEEKQEDEWDLSGTINQCIKRYAERLTEDQLNEILLGLENGLTEEEVKSYFTFPVEKMNQYRRAYQFMQ